MGFGAGGAQLTDHTLNGAGKTETTMQVVVSRSPTPLCFGVLMP